MTHRNLQHSFVPAMRSQEDVQKVYGVRCAWCRLFTPSLKIAFALSTMGDWCSNGSLEEHDWIITPVLTGEVIHLECKDCRLQSTDTMLFRRGSIAAPKKASYPAWEVRYQHFRAAVEKAVERLDAEITGLKDLI